MIKTIIKEQEECEIDDKYNSLLTKKIDTLFKDMLRFLEHMEKENMTELPKNSFHTVFKLFTMNFLKYDPEKESLLFSLPSQSLTEFKDKI